LAWDRTPDYLEHTTVRGCLLETSEYFTGSQKKSGIEIIVVLSAIWVSGPYYLFLHCAEMAGENDAVHEHITVLGIQHY